MSPSSVGGDVLDDPDPQRLPGPHGRVGEPHHPTPCGTNRHRVSHTGSPRVQSRSISSHAIALTTPATSSGTHDVPGVTGE
ncbi:hypothetical protein IU11_07370 [Cellulosimicrobium sp. MM]|nr:hypothetical protein IU11_07370 [Cellulosimicrobium sp. MM]